METEQLYAKSVAYLKTFCDVIGDRSVGSIGNRDATDYFRNEVSSLGWTTDVTQLDVMDWEDGGATLIVGDRRVNVSVSPYSRGCDVGAKLVCAASIGELEQSDVDGQVVLLHGEIAREQLMPKNFAFYNPEEHQRIIAVLEAKEPAAIISATGRNSALAGGVYPFPLIEDGDFDIPSVFMTEEDGEELLAHAGEVVTLISDSRRIPSTAYNVVSRLAGNPLERIVISAHIDAKKGTPGAIDNATGVGVLLLLAELLRDYDGDKTLELVAFNGEDYYAAPGQMDYIRKNESRFDEMILNINIDGAGYKEGKSAFSLFDLPEAMHSSSHQAIGRYPGITEGILWPQGDHSIFVQQGRPAIAVSSQWFIDHMESQSITHTPRDNSDIVDCRKVVEIAEALNWLIRAIV